MKTSVKQRKFNRYTVESVEVQKAEWGETHVADIRLANEDIAYRIGPAYSEKQLIQMVLERFGQ